MNNLQSRFKNSPNKLVNNQNDVIY